MSQVDGPFPIVANALPDNDLLFNFRLIARETGFEIQRQTDGVVRGIPNHVTVFHGDAGKFELRLIRFRGVTKALRFGVPFILAQA